MAFADSSFGSDTFSESRCEVVWYDGTIFSDSDSAPGDGGCGTAAAPLVLSETN